jgi:hypothetical protein
MTFLISFVATVFASRLLRDVHDNALLLINDERMDVEGNVHNGSHEIISAQCDLPTLKFDDNKCVKSVVNGKRIIVVRCKWGTNYYHGLVNEVHRFYRTCSHPPSDDVRLFCETALIYTSGAPRELEWFKAIGVDPSRAIRELPTGPLSILIARGISCGGFPSAIEAENLWWTLRRHYYVRRAPKHPPKIVWMSRATAGQRRVVNEQQVLQWLRDAWKKWQPNVDIEVQIHTPGHNTSDTFNMLQTATLMVGAHGAGLTNLMLAPKSTAIIELHPLRYSADQVTCNIYAIMCRQLNMRYSQTACETSGISDFEVGEAQLHAALASVAGVIPWS